MAEGVKPPPPFDPSKGTATEWPQWKDHFEFYLKATTQSGEDGPTKVVIFLTAMGKEAIPYTRR